jgi:hypothetical protein
MSEAHTSSTKRLRWASTTPLTAPLGRSSGTPRKHTRVVHAPPLRVARARLAGAVLLLGAGLEIAAIFPTFGAAGQQFPLNTVFDGPALSSSLAALLQQTIPVAPWILAALLIARGQPPALRAGVGLAAGSVGLGAALTLFPLAQVVHSGMHLAGAGMWLALAGAAVGVVGVIMGLGELSHSWDLDAVVRPTSGRLLFALLAGAAVCVGSAFGWMVYVLNVPGEDQAVQLSGAFSHPWPVMVVQVIVILVIVALAVLAVAWTRRIAAALAVGLAVPLMARVAATAVRLSDGITFRQAGLTPAALKATGITAAQVHLAVQPDKWLWVEVGGLVALVLLALYLTLRPEPAPEAA